jgi:hypothetical protein
MITNTLMIGSGADFHAGKGGGSYLGALSNINFDGMNASTGLHIAAGQITHTGGYMTVGCSNGAINGIQVDGGYYTLNSMNIHDYSCGLGNLLQVNAGTVNATGLNLFRETTNGTTMLSDVYLHGSGAQLNLSGAILARNPGTNWSNPFISVNNGRATLIGNRVNGLTTGSGTFISIANDDYHASAYNVGPGWAQSYPTAANGQYQWGAALTMPSAAAGVATLPGVLTNQIKSTGTPVTLTSGFGTAPSITGNDLSFKVTLGNPVGTSGIVALKQPWINAPGIVCSINSASTVSVTTTTTQVTLAQGLGTWVAGNVISCIALGSN